MEPFQKCFYQESEAMRNVTWEETAATRLEAAMTIVNDGEGELRAPKPVKSFSDVGLPQYCLDQMSNAGFSAPTPVQAQGWPIVLCGRDMIGIAQTGSGKTLSFLMPGVIHILAQPPIKSYHDGPIMTILSPTRELAMQIQVECDKFGAGPNVRNVAVFGGVPKHAQLGAMREGREIIVATPGRLIDFIENGSFTLRRTTMLVLDEADRMLDMGFEDQVRKIAAQIRPDRQTLLWSATWPKEVQSLARDLCKENPVHLNIGGEGLRANHRITQIVEVFEGYNTYYDRKQRLAQLLREIMDGSKIIIFAETKRGCDDLTRDMRTSGYPALSIHGDKTQSERDWVLNEFRAGKNPILIATDVAARGLDVKDIKTVINFDFPGAVEDYVHRIGRTARAGETGTSYTFMTPEKGKHSKELMEIMTEAKQVIPQCLLDLAENSRGFKGRTRNRGGGGGKEKGGDKDKGRERSRDRKGGSSKGGSKGKDSKGGSYGGGGGNMMAGGNMGMMGMMSMGMGTW